jgi:hypothetical protein
VTAVVVALSLPTGALTLWARPADWPSQTALVRGLRLDALWQTLRALPAGRVLFLRSGVPLVYGTAWYRPHSHLTALTPVLAGRDILGGTFTHGSPVASVVYRGDARRRAVTTLAEQLDGESLFGRRLDVLDAATFDAYATRFRIAAVVALDEDAGRVPFLAGNARYRRLELPPFIVFVALQPPPAIGPHVHRSRDVAIAATPEGWASTGIAYYPLWRAEHGGRGIETRRGDHGDLEVKADATITSVRLTYAPGLVEILALMLSGAALIGLAVEETWARGRGRSALRDVAAGQDAKRGADGVGRVEDPRLQR